MDYYKYTKYKNKLNKLKGGSISKRDLSELQDINKVFENSVGGFCTTNDCNDRLSNLIKRSSNYLKHITPNEYDKDFKKKIEIVKENLDSDSCAEVLDFGVYVITTKLNMKKKHIDREYIKESIRNISPDGFIKQVGGDDTVLLMAMLGLILPFVVMGCFWSVYTEHRSRAYQRANERRLRDAYGDAYGVRDTTPLYPPPPLIG